MVSERKKENGSLGEADGWVRDVSERGRARAGLGWVAGSRAGKLDGLAQLGWLAIFFCLKRFSNFSTSKQFKTRSKQLQT